VAGELILGQAVVQRGGKYRNGNTKCDEVIMYEERVLAYIDILGFSNAVEKTINKETESEIYYETEKIDNLLDEENFHLNIREYLVSRQRINGKVTSQFSDSVIISYLKENDIYNILQDVYFLCVMALEKGFLFRGAIVSGKLFHTEKKIFGPALVEAVKLEKSKAIFPRIIVAKDILDIAKNNYSKCVEPDVEYMNLMELVSCDFDGFYYINYIEKLYTGVDVGINKEEEHLIWLCNTIKDLKNKFDLDDGIKCKYFWLKEKLIIVLKKYKTKYKNEEIQNIFPKLFNCLKGIDVIV